MKRFYIILLLLLFYFFAYSQQVPNGDFELWTGNTPDQWDTSNESVMGTNFSTVTKESVAFSGSYAAKVKNDTKYIFPVGNVTMPGILTLGDFVLDIVNQTGNIVGGKPFPYRPYSLKGYYKSTPLGGNTPMIGIGLSKWNYQTNTRDTIGFSVMYFPNTVNNWTEFEIIINWTSNEVPDSMNIIIAAADLVSGETFATNSAIFVDNLYFEYPQSQEIISVGDFNPIYVSYGTLFSQLPLPEQAWVTLDDNSNELLNVVWNQGPYPSNGDIPGEYILEGDLELVSGILNPNNLKA
ncbi:MAG TPA: PCMD domain-containing protein, partial [Bacteroidales bacterium]|nr:PCMD domain-containing protein [Bacteroidales bacterium]